MNSRFLPPDASPPKAGGVEAVYPLKKYGRKTQVIQSLLAGIFRF